MKSIELKKKNDFTAEETGISRKMTTRSYVWQSVRFYFKWWQAHSFLYWFTICFCVFHPPHLPDNNMEYIMNHTYPSRAVSCCPDETSFRLNSSRPSFLLQSEFWNGLAHLSCGLMWWLKSYNALSSGHAERISEGISPPSSRLQVSNKLDVDCTKVVIERPTSLQTRAIIYSHYKSHNTVKFLVGISPTGAITFLLKFWVGRASNKVIIQNSGLIDLLEQGDHVMADRGFNFPEYFSTKCVCLHVPASTMKENSWQNLAVTESRKMSWVRIHVERAIGKLKSFRILRNILPVSMVKRRNDNSLCTIDKILIVCAALSNLGKQLVPR